jgi:hypothetical protein
MHAPLHDDPVRLSQDGVRAEFAKNPRILTFNKGLSNDATFSQIHIVGQ